MRIPFFFISLDRVTINFCDAFVEKSVPRYHIVTPMRSGLIDVYSPSLFVALQALISLLMITLNLPQCIESIKNEISSSHC